MKLCSLEREGWLWMSPPFLVVQVACTRLRSITVSFFPDLHLVYRLLRFQDLFELKIKGITCLNGHDATIKPLQIGLKSNLTD